MNSALDASGKARNRASICLTEGVEESSEEGF